MPILAFLGVMVGTYWASVLLHSMAHAGLRDHGRKITILSCRGMGGKWLKLNGV